MSELVSVIVPVYNVEQYLRQCLDSIVQQTYPHLDIVIVDDGSTDKSGMICDEYAQRDARIRVLHVTNGGLSHARNIGIENAKGKYLTFIDSDDFVNDEYIEILYQGLVDYDADISLAFPYELVESRGVYKLLYLDKVESGIFSPQQIIGFTNVDDAAVFVPGTSYTTACWKLFKKELFDTVRFPLGVLYEDAATVHKLYLKAQKIAQIAKGIYCYRIRETSLSHSKPSLKNVQSILHYCRVRTDDLFHAGLDPRLDFVFQKKELGWGKRVLEEAGLQHTIEYRQVLQRLEAIDRLEEVHV